MSPLFYVLIAVSIGAVAVTIHAFLSAPEGYEDEDGFHTVNEVSETPHTHDQQSGDAGARTFYSAR
jgi:hypothetical protein